MVKMIKNILSVALTSSFLVLQGCAYSMESAATSPTLANADPAQGPSDDIQYTLKQLDGPSFFHLLLAELALMNDAPEAALDFYLAAWEDHPNDPALLQVLAPLAARLGNPDLALMLYQNWAQAEPHRREIWHGLWQISINQRAAEPAALAITRLLNINPDYDLNIPYRSLLNWSAEEAHQLYLALTAQVTGLNNRNDGIQLLGVLTAQAQRPEAAEIYWQRLADNLKDSEQWSFYAQSLNELGLTEASLILIEQPQWRDEPTARIIKSRILSDQGLTHEALELLLPIIAQQPESLELLLHVAELATVTHHPRRDEWLSQLLDTSASDAARRLLAEVAITEHRYGQARTWLNQIRDSSEAVIGTSLIIQTLVAAPLSEQEVVELFEQWRHRHPNASLEMIEQQARYWYEQGFYERAYDDYSLGLRSNPNDFFFLYMRALSAEPLDRLDTLEQDLRRILWLDPNNTAALNALGYTLIDRTDRIEEAAPMIEQAYAQNPDSFAITDSLGWLRFKQGRFQEAVDILARALSMQDETLDDDEVVSHYVEALWRNGQVEQALAVASDWLTRFESTDRLRNLLKDLGLSN